MIVASNVSKSFGRLKVLNSISFECRKGETVSLIGPNSSGKTTLIKCLLGMVIPDGGSILFDGRSIAGNWQYRSHVGYMPQIGRYPDNMTIEHVFDLICEIRKKPLNACDTELIREFGLEKIYDKRMRTLSGGTRQKVSASIAFLFNPDVIILDEPTAGLDPLSSELLKTKIMAEKQKGKLILITSHILSDLDDLVTEVLYMQEGRLLFHKSMEKLRSDTGETKLSRAIASVMKSNQ